MAKIINKKVGRPSVYDKKYCKMLVDFFDIKPYEDVIINHFGASGEIKWQDKKRMASPLPTVRNFCKSISIHYDTFYSWLKEHKEFSDSYTHAEDLRKWFLIENGLQGNYNPAFAIFVAKNITDMKDTHEVTGKDGKDLFQGVAVDVLTDVIKRATNSQSQANS